MDEWRHLWRTCWTEGTPAMRFRLATLLSLLTVLIVLAVSLVEELWLGFADAVVRALTS